MYDEVTEARLSILSATLNVSKNTVIAAALLLFEQQLNFEDQGRVTAYVVPDSHGVPKGQMQYRTENIRQWLRKNATR